MYLRFFDCEVRRYPEPSTNINFQLIKTNSMTRDTLGDTLPQTSIPDYPPAPCFLIKELSWQLAQNEFNAPHSI